MDMRVILFGKSLLVLLLGTVVLLSLFIGNLAGVMEYPRHSGDSIDVMYGSDVVIDAVISENEWSDANTIQRNIDGKTWTVYYKESGENLYIAYDYPGENMVDILIDVNHNGGSAPQTDDLFFHSSLADWEKFGTGYDWCDDYIDPNGWEVAVDNNYYQREFRISYDKLGIISGLDKTLGICFDISVTSLPGTTFWPTAGNLNSPNTWADMYSSNKWAAEQPVNNIPELTGNMLVPDSGFTDTEFTFSVIYADSDNDVPEVSAVIIDNVFHEMDTIDTSYSSGCLFKFTTTLDSGIHEYYFKFNDSRSEVRLPASGTFKTPYIQLPNSPPELINGGIPNGTFAIAEDSQQGDNLINLEEYFTDDRDDGNLRFDLIYQDEIDKVKGTIVGQYINLEQKLENWFGTLEFQVKARDKGVDDIIDNEDDLECISNKFTVTVNPIPDTPIIKKIENKVVKSGQAIIFSGEYSAYEDYWFNISITASDPDIEFNDSDHLIFETNSSKIVITPDIEEPLKATASLFPINDDVGTIFVQISVKDSYDYVDTVDLEIQIKNTNDNPWIDSIIHEGEKIPVKGDLIKFSGSKAACEDEWFYIDIIALDPDIEIGADEELTFKCNITKANFNIDESTGKISFLPNQEDVGVFYAQITVSDKYGTEADDFIELAIKVKNTNDPPETPKILVEKGKNIFKYGEYVNFTCSATDPDIKYDKKEKLTLSWESNKDGLLGTGDRLNIRSLSPGMHNITLTVTDKYGAESSASKTIRIEPLNDRTTGTNKKASGKQDIYSWLILIFMIIVIAVIITLILYIKKKNSKNKIELPPNQQPLTSQTQFDQQIYSDQQYPQMTQPQIPPNQSMQFPFPQQNAPLQQDLSYQQYSPINYQQLFLPQQNQPYQQYPHSQQPLPSIPITPFSSQYQKPNTSKQLEIIKETNQKGNEKV
ncbi:hypothetical protein [[Eubacterium] cellulosolvens]